MDDLPHGIRVAEEPATYQANCTHCGWHTRPSYAKAVTMRLARQHVDSCPHPLRPIGALMSCGCWWHALPGTEVGVTERTCPVHGDVLMVEANVEGRPWGTGTWQENDG